MKFSIPLLCMISAVLVNDGQTIVIEEALCLLESSSPLTIRIDVILSNVRSPVVACTDDATDKAIPLESVTVTATSEILNATLMPIGSPVGNFTCLITGEDGSESVSCTLIASNIPAPVNLIPIRQTPTRARFIWNSLIDHAFHQLILEGSDGTTISIFTSANVTEAIADGLNSSVIYTARVFTLGSQMGTSVTLPGEGSKTAILLPLCQPAQGQRLEVVLQPVEGEIDGGLCAIVDNESGFIKEALDFVFIEPESLPEDCMVVPFKILSFSCQEQRERSRSGSRSGSRRSNRRSNRPKIDITALFFCEPCTGLEPGDVVEAMTGGTRRRVGSGRNRISSEIVLRDRLPERVIVRRLIFDVVRVREIGRREPFCGCMRLGRRAIQQCDCPELCFIK